MATIFQTRPMTPLTVLHPDFKVTTVPEGYTYPIILSKYKNFDSRLNLTTKAL